MMRKVLLEELETLLVKRDAGEKIDLSDCLLDGLDLSDDNIRLFVARRNIDGHTRLERIEYREGRNMLLSELWMSGLIGGLPDNF